MIVSTFALRRKAAGFLETSQCTGTQQHKSAEKSGLQDVKRADFFQYWQRSVLKNLDKRKIFIKKNIRNHSYHQIYPFWQRSRSNKVYWTSITKLLVKQIQHYVSFIAQWSQNGSLQTLQSCQFLNWCLFWSSLWPWILGTNQRSAISILKCKWQSWILVRKSSWHNTLQQSV